MASAGRSGFWIRRCETTFDEATLGGVRVDLSVEHRFDRLVGNVGQMIRSHSRAAADTKCPKRMVALLRLSKNGIRELPRPEPAKLSVEYKDSVLCKVRH